MKTLIVYGSKYGATKEVAEMIGDRFKDVKIIDVNEFNEAIETYELIILGSNTTAGLMNKKIKQLFTLLDLKKQKVVVYITGLQKDSLETVIEQNLTKDVITNSYFVGGKLNFLRMNVFEKSIIKLINKKAKFIESIDAKQVYDFFDYEEINRMIAALIKIK